MSEPHVLLRIGRFVYNEFWKVVFALFAVVNAAAAMGLLKLFWSEPVFYAGATAILLGVAAGYVELELLAKALGWGEGPIPDWRERATWLLLIGYGLCLALTLGLSIHEVQSRQRGRIMEAERQRQREEWNKALNSPDARRAMEAMERLRPSTNK